MNFQSHEIIGLASVCTATAAATLVTGEPPSILQFAGCIATGLIAAVLPDIDSDESKSRNTVRFIVTVSILAAVLLGVLHYKTSVHIDTAWLTKIFTPPVIAFIALILIGTRQKHRCMTHSFLYSTVLSALIFSITGSFYMTLAFFIGMVSHILADIPNKRKVYLFWPLPIGVCLNLYRANGFFSRVVDGIAFLVFVAAVLANFVLMFRFR